jgi:3-oxoadipate enol-lactonase
MPEEEAAMARSGIVNANGQELHFDEQGAGDPLVLIMGIGYDSTLWMLHQVPALARRFTVITFDNRDAGRSAAANGSYTIGDMADDVAGLLDGLEVQRAHVVGLSMGAMIAQEFALRHADRLDHLVLSGPDPAPARQAFHPIAVWNWVKAEDTAGAMFAAQQFAWLFSAAFRRNPRPCSRRWSSWPAIRIRSGPTPTHARRAPTSNTMGRSSRRHHCAHSRHRRRAGSAHATMAGA